MVTFEQTNTTIIITKPDIYSLQLCYHIQWVSQPFFGLLPPPPGLDEGLGPLGPPVVPHGAPGHLVLCEDWQVVPAMSPIYPCTAAGISWLTCRPRLPCPAWPSRRPGCSPWSCSSPCCGSASGWSWSCPPPPRLSWPPGGPRWCWTSWCWAGRPPSPRAPSETWRSDLRREVIRSLVGRWNLTWLLPMSIP